MEVGQTDNIRKMKFTKINLKILNLKCKNVLKHFFHTFFQSENFFGFPILNSIENLVIGYFRVYIRSEKCN